MFSITDLPRNEGVIERDFLAKHASSSFTLEAHDFHFVDGLTKAPVRGLCPDRLCAAYGSDISFVPCDRDSGLAALAWMKRHGQPPQRIDRLTGELDALFTAALPEHAEVGAQVAPDVFAEKGSAEEALFTDDAPEPPKSARSYPATSDDLDTDHATPRAKGKGHR